MDWDMQKTSVVIVGDGFSAAASNGKMPLMTGFFDQLSKEHFPELLEFVTEVGCSCRCPTIAQANVESVLTSLDQMRTAPARALCGTLARFRGAFPAIQAQLTAYTLQRLKLGSCVQTDNWAAQLLASCGFATTVVSMNYDNLAETILSNRDGVRHGGRNPNCPHCRMRLLLSDACSCNIKSDELFTQTIRSAVNERRKLTRVASIALDPENVLERFEDCLPPGMDVDATAYPVEVGCDPIWLPEDVKQICKEMSSQVLPAST